MRACSIAPQRKASARPAARRSYLLVALSLHRLGELFRFLDRRRADQHRLEFGVGGLNFARDGAQFLFGGAIDLIIFVEPPRPACLSEFRRLRAYRFSEFIRLRRRRSGHAGEFGIKPEIILEGDRGQRHVLRLDLHMFLGFKGPDADLPNNAGPASCGRYIHQ